jgi:UDP-GlcNAc:undecaprenyl-phosphate GlcNAc-1-phosphate transferase
MYMYPIFLAGLCAFLFCVVLTPFCRDLFRKWGFVDEPDHSRKLHTEPVPHMGGVPLAIAYVASIGLLAMLPGRVLQIHFIHIAAAAPAGFIMFMTGVLDDMLHLRPWQKLCGQALAAICAFEAGVQVNSVAGHSVGWLSLPVTMIWLIGCANAFNLIDGVDGLASGVGLFATATMLIAALLQRNVVLAMVTAPLVGALLGFLRYNFNPASIFLGDSGSLVIGFLLGSFGVVWSQKSATILGMTAPMMALGIPILDTGLSIGRRFLRHQPIFGADRDHIHHRLLKRGFKPRGVALILYAVASLVATLSLLSVSSNRMAGAVVMIFCAAAWIGIQHLGYTEFGTAGRMLLAGTFQQTLDAQLRVRSFEQSLMASKTLDQCWEIIVETAPLFDFVDVRLSIGGMGYYKILRDLDEELCWHLRVPLPGNGYINFARPHESTVRSMGVTPFIDVIRKSLIFKCQEFGLGAPQVLVAGRSR